MAAKLYTEDIDKTINWAGDEKTNGLPVSGEKVQKFIKETLDKKFGYIYYDKDVLDNDAGTDGTLTGKNRYIIFADEDDFNAWKASGGADNTLVRGNFDAPAPAIIEISNQSKQVNTILLSEAEGQKLSFNYLVKDSSNHIQPSRMQVAISINNNISGITTVPTQTLDLVYSETPIAYEFLIGEYLNEGTNTITITLTSLQYNVSTNITYQYKVLNLMLTSTFDDPGSDFYYFNGISLTNNEYFGTTLTASGTGPKYLRVYIDGKNVDGEEVEGRTKPSRYIGSNSPQSYDLNLQFKNEAGEYNSWATAGKHSLQFYFFVLNEVSEEVKSQTLYYDIVFTEVGMQHESYVLFSRTLDQGELVNKEDRLKLSSEQYESISVEYAIYDTSGRGNNEDGSAVIVDLKLTKKKEEGEDNDTVIMNTKAAVASGSKSVFTYTFNTYGNIVLDIKNTASGGETISIDLKVAQSSVQIESVKSNLVLELSALNRSNNEPADERSVWEYIYTPVGTTISTSYKAQFENVLWNTQNGWIDDCLVLNNGATVTLPINLFNQWNSGLTFEIDFETSNVQDDDAEIMKYGSSAGAHIFINACNAELQSNNKVNIHTNYKENSRQKIQFIFNGNSFNTNEDAAKTESPYLMYIVVNGILDRAIQFTNTDSLGANSPSNIVIGNMDGKATIKIHSIRIYRRALTLDECVDNYIADSKSIRQIYLKNDVYNEGSKTINVNAILNANIHIPVMTIFGNVTDSIVQVFNKKSNVPIDVLYQDPENPEFNFFVHDAWMSNQGTSSMNYPRRNFRLYLNKQASSETLRGFAPNHAYLYQTVLWTGLTDETTIEKIQTGQIEDLSKPLTVGDVTYYPTGNKKWTEEDGSTNKKKYAYCAPINYEKARWLWHSGCDLYKCKDVLKNPDDPSEGTKKEWSKIKNYSEEVSKGTQLYAFGNWARFKTKDLYTDRWTIKCDYAESSMCHNAGVGRLWGDVMRDVEIPDGGFRYDTQGNKVVTSQPGMTNAQFAAKQYNLEHPEIKDGYGDIRTSCDGRPIIIVNRKRLKDSEGNYTGRFGDPIFLGLYNIMTDKGSTPLFGFEDLRNDDNTLLYEAGNDTQRTECWECLQNGSELAQMSNIITDDTDGSTVIYDEEGSANEDRPIFKTYEARWPDNDYLDNTRTNKLETVIRFVNFCKDAVSVKVGNPENAKDGYTLSDFTEITEEQAEYYSEHLDEVANGTLYIGVPTASYKDKTTTFYRYDEAGNIMYDENEKPLLLRIDEPDEYNALAKAVNKAIYFYQDYAAQNVTGSSFSPLYSSSASTDAKIAAVLGQLNSSRPYVFTESLDESQIEQVEQVYYPNSGYTWYIFDNTYDRSIVTKTINTETLKDDVYTGKVYTFDGKRVDSNGEQVFPDAWVTVYLNKSGNKYTYMNEMGELNTPYASGEDIITEVGSGNAVARGTSFKGHTLMEYFKDKKYEHFDVWKLAAYYVYIMRFAAVDQVIKNTMMTTEDGIHYYFINYDNDTVMGVRNDGYLAYDWQVTRETYDYSIGSYAYAGFGSVLWNLLEQDDDFMSKVQTMATSMVTSGVLTYDIALDMFNNKQAGTWSERLYNNSEMYKYIGTFNDLDNVGTAAYNPYQNTKYLPFLQGSRASHRDWWLRHRFDLYDSKWGAGEYATNALEFYMGLTASQSNKKKFLRMVPGSRFYYTIQSNNRTLGNNFIELAPEKETNPELIAKYGEDKSYWFETEETLILGNPMKMLGTYKVKVLDFSDFRDSVGSSMNFNWDKSKGSMMTELIIGGPKTLDEQNGCALQTISNLDRLESLEVFDIRTCYNLSSTPDISNLYNLKKFLASDSNITNFLPAKGLNMTEISLPSSIQNMVLDNISIAQPTEEELENGITTKFNYSPNTALTHVEILDCEGIDIIEFLDTWYQDLKRWNVLMTNYSCVLSFNTLELPEKIGEVDSLTWLNNLRRELGKNENGEDNFKIKKGIIRLYGHAEEDGQPTGGLTEEDYAEILKYWPEEYFRSDNAVHFDANKSIFITVKSGSSRFHYDDVDECYKIVGGQSATINVTIFPSNNEREIKLIPYHLTQSNSYTHTGWDDLGNVSTYNFGILNANTVLTNDNGSATLVTGEYTNGTKKRVRLSISDSLDSTSINKNYVVFEIEDTVIPVNLQIFDEENTNISGLVQEITNIDKIYKYRVAFKESGVNVDVKSIKATFGNTNLSDTENGSVEAYIDEEDNNMYVRFTPKLNKGETDNTSINIRVKVNMADKANTEITRGNIINIVIRTNDIKNIVLKSDGTELTKDSETGNYIIENYIKNISSGQNQIVYHYDVNINPEDYNVKIQSMSLDVTNVISENIEIANVETNALTNVITGFDIIVKKLQAKKTIYEIHELGISAIAIDSNGNITTELNQLVNIKIGCFYPDEIKLIKNEGSQWVSNYNNIDLLNGENKNVRYELHIYSNINGQLYYWNYNDEPADDIISATVDEIPHFLVKDQLPTGLDITSLKVEAEEPERISDVITGSINLNDSNTAHPGFNLATNNSGITSLVFNVSYAITFNGSKKTFTESFTISISPAVAAQGQWQNLPIDSNIQNNFYFIDKNMRIYKGENLGSIEKIGSLGAENIITAILYIYEDNGANKQIISMDPWLLKNQKKCYWYSQNSTFANHDYGKCIANDNPNGLSYNLLLQLNGYNGSDFNMISPAQRFEAMYNVYAFISAYSDGTNSADGGNYDIVDAETGRPITLTSINNEVIERIANKRYMITKQTTDSNMIFSIFDYYKTKYSMNVNGRLLTTEELGILYSVRDEFAEALKALDNSINWADLLYEDENHFIITNQTQLNEYNSAHPGNGTYRTVQEALLEGTGNSDLTDCSRIKVIWSADPRSPWDSAPIMIPSVIALDKSYENGNLNILGEHSAVYNSNNRARAYWYAYGIFTPSI